MNEGIRMLPSSAIAAARETGALALHLPRAAAVRYLEQSDRIEIDLVSGWSLQVPRWFSPRLLRGSADDWAHIELTDSGLGLHWPTLDEDWYVSAVIESLTAQAAT
jgi:hypothetical protein